MRLVNLTEIYLLMLSNYGSNYFDVCSELDISKIKPAQTIIIFNYDNKKSVDLDILHNRLEPYIQNVSKYFVSMDEYTITLCIIFHNEYCNINFKQSFSLN